MLWCFKALLCIVPIAVVEAASCQEYPNCPSEYPTCAEGKCYSGWYADPNGCTCLTHYQQTVNALEDCFAGEVQNAPASTSTAGESECTFSEEDEDGQHDKMLSCTMWPKPFIVGTACKPVEVFNRCDGDEPLQTGDENNLNVVVASFADLRLQPNVSLRFTTKDMPKSIPGKVELSVRFMVDIAFTFMISGNYEKVIDHKITGTAPTVICVGGACMIVRLNLGLQFRLNLKGFAKVHLRLQRVYHLSSKFDVDMAGKSSTKMTNDITVESDNWVLESSADIDGSVSASLVPELNIAGAGASLSLKFLFTLEPKVFGHFHLKRQKGTFDDDQFRCYTPSCNALAQKMNKISCDPTDSRCSYCNGDAGDGSLIQLPRDVTAASVSLSLEARVDFVVAYTALDLESVVGPLREQCKKYLSEYAPNLECFAGSLKVDGSSLSDKISNACEAGLSLSSYATGHEFQPYNLFNKTLYELHWRSAECASQSSAEASATSMTPVQHEAMGAANHGDVTEGELELASATAKSKVLNAVTAVILLLLRSVSHLD